MMSFAPTRARAATRYAPTAALLGVLAGCTGAPEPNFSQYPGFAEYFADHPRASEPADAGERALLRRHRPILFVAQDNEGPIDFYRDYIAEGRLFGPSGDEVSADVTPALLNRYRDEPAAVFEHEPHARTSRPVAYGRVDRARVPALGPVTFLTWHFVFRTSGLPAGLSGPLEWAAAIFADTHDWHQLDHYTSATLALDCAERPFALMLMHHNYKRTYLVGRDVALQDGRPRIGAAVRSNELYPVQGRSERRWRAVRFIDDEGAARWLTQGEGGGMTATHDIVRPERRVDYALDFLPPDDAFYAFHGYLGELRWLPGRSGPPGADYETLPPLKPLRRQLVAFAWEPGEPADLRRRLRLAEEQPPQGLYRDLATRLAGEVARVELAGGRTGATAGGPGGCAGVATGSAEVGAGRGPG